MQSIQIQKQDQPTSEEAKTPMIMNAINMTVMYIRLTGSVRRKSCVVVKIDFSNPASAESGSGMSLCNKFGSEGVLV